MGTNESLLRSIESKPPTTSSHPKKNLSKLHKQQLLPSPSSCLCTISPPSSPRLLPSAPSSTRLLSSPSSLPSSELPTRGPRPPTPRRSSSAQRRPPLRLSPGAPPSLDPPSRVMVWEL